VNVTRFSPSIVMRRPLMQTAQRSGSKHEAILLFGSSCIIVIVQLPPPVLKVILRPV